MISLLKFIIDDSPGDILILCEHGAHRSAGLALLLLFCLGYDDVSHTADVLERTRYVIDCSASSRNYSPQTVRVLGMQDELRKWMGDIFPLWGNRRKVIEGLVSAKEFEKIAKDEVPKALAAQAEQAAKGTASPRATSQSAASNDPPIKRTSDVTVPLEADDKKKPRAEAAVGNAGSASRVSTRRTEKKASDDSAIQPESKWSLQACCKALASPGRQSASVPPPAADHHAEEAAEHGATRRALEAHTKLLKEHSKQQKKVADALVAERTERTQQLERDLAARTQDLEEERQKTAELAERLRVLEDIVECRDAKPPVAEVCGMIMDNRFEDGCLCRFSVHNRPQ